MTRHDEPAEGDVAGVAEAEHIAHSGPCRYHLGVCIQQPERATERAQ